jgi:hypothetical protein
MFTDERDVVLTAIFHLLKEDITAEMSDHIIDIRGKTDETNHTTAVDNPVMY